MPKNSQQDRVEVVTVSGRVGQTSTAFGCATWSLAPSGSISICQNSNKITQLADLFQYYRVKKLKLILGPYDPALTGATEAEIGVTEGEVISPPTSQGTVLDCPWAKVKPANITMPMMWNVPRRFYTGQLGWYKTYQNANIDQQLEVCGQVHIHSSINNGSVAISFEATYEFKCFIGTATNPMRSLPDIDEEKRLREVPSSAVLDVMAQNRYFEAHNDVTGDSEAPCQDKGGVRSLKGPPDKSSANDEDADRVSQASLVLVRRPAIRR